MTRKPLVYRAARVADLNPGFESWGIVGGWKTINSTMGAYRTKADAEAAIARMTREPRVVVVRKVPRLTSQGGRSPNR